MPIDLSQFRQVFFDEAAEYLSTAEALLLYLDPHDPDAEQIEDIFRAVHSIKGSSGTFGFKAMADLAQQMQSLLDRVRSGMRLSVPAHDALVDACRILKRLLAAYRSGSGEDVEGAALAGVRLARIAEGREDVVSIPLEPVEAVAEVGPLTALRERDLAAMAGDLRDLAQRAAAAAKEIVQLVRTSAADADAGTELAREAEESIGDMMSSFGRLEGVVVSMAAEASGPDARDIAEAVRRLGDAIRQNEARVRQSAETAASLRERFDALAQVVARFALPGAPGRDAARATGAKGSARPRTPLPKFRRIVGGSEGDGECGECGEWPQF